MTPDKKFLRYSGEVFDDKGERLGRIHVWVDPTKCEDVTWHEDTDRITLNFPDRFLCVPRLEFLRQIYPYQGFSFLESVGPKPEPQPGEPFQACVSCGQPAHAWTPDGRGWCPRHSGGHEPPALVAESAQQANVGKAFHEALNKVTADPSLQLRIGDALPEVQSEPAKEDPNKATLIAEMAAADLASAVVAASERVAAKESKEQTGTQHSWSKGDFATVNLPNQPLHTRRVWRVFPKVLWLCDPKDFETAQQEDRDPSCIAVAREFVL